MKTPPLTNLYLTNAGVLCRFEYHEVDDFDMLEGLEVRQCYSTAFCGDKMVLVHNGKKDHWGLVGGTVEPGEILEETLVREIQEESNMKVLEMRPIGYQKVINLKGGEEDYYQTRWFAVVEPYGPFESDPDGTIDKIALVDPQEYKDFFDWGETGDAIVGKGVRLLGESRG